MHFYQHHISDFNNATRHLSRIERSIYRDLIELYYDSEQPLTLCFKTLCRKIIAKTEEEVTAVEQVLNEFFTETEQGWVNKRCQLEIDKYQSDIRNKSQAGKASAAKRSGNNKQPSNTDKQPFNGTNTCDEQPFNGTNTCDEQPLNVSNTDDEQINNGSSTAVEQVLNRRSTNHEPLTNNHINTPLPPTRGKKGFDASLIELPDWLNPSDWSAWVADRKQRKKPITERAAALQIKQLADYRQQGYSPHEVIQNSIAGGYQGLFPPSKTKSNVQTTQEWGREMTRVCEVNIRNAFEQEIQPTIGVIDATSN